MSNFVLFWRAVFFALLAIVTYLTVAPNPPQADGGFAATRMIAEFLFGDAGQGDKIGHFMAYGALGGAARFAFRGRGLFWSTPALLAAYGAGLEGAQYFIDVRSADLIDAAANSLGAVTGYSTAAILQRSFRPRAR